MIMKPDVPEKEGNKVPNNLKNTPRGVNPINRAGFYANEKPEILGKTLEESSGAPKGAVFPIIETIPETVFVEWGTRPSTAEVDPPREEPVNEEVRGPGFYTDFILKTGITPLDSVANAEVEVFFPTSPSEFDRIVENLTDVDFSLHEDDIYLMYIPGKSRSKELRLVAEGGTYSLVARVNSSQGSATPLSSGVTYVKVTIPEESKVVSKLPSELVEGMPLVVNCSIERNEMTGTDYAVFDKTFAEMQNYKIEDIQFRFNSFKSLKQGYNTEGDGLDKLSEYAAWFYDIDISVDGDLTIIMYIFVLNELDEASFSVRNCFFADSGGAKAEDGKQLIK